MREQPPVYFFDGDAPELLARAGRATSSFPVAFEPHSLAFMGERPEDQPDHRWLIDGGVLDNQPFNPVLDRISILPSGLPVRRVVAYVVPYVNEPEAILREETPIRRRRRTKARPSRQSRTARSVFAATGALPRTLPKLQSLERVLREWTRAGGWPRATAACSGRSAGADDARASIREGRGQISSRPYRRTR